jgi:hypothetical protein
MNSIVQSIAFKNEAHKNFIEFFMILWNQQSILTDNPYNIKLCLPDTILFMNHKPITWLFTNKREQIRRKKIKNVTLPLIRKALFQARSRSGICGYYLAFKQENGTSTPSTLTQGQGFIYKQYVRYEDFDRFFASEEKLPHGIFQFFLTPLGNHNRTLPQDDRRADKSELQWRYTADEPRQQPDGLHENPLRCLRADEHVRSAQLPRQRR